MFRKELAAKAEDSASENGMAGKALLTVMNVSQAAVIRLSTPDKAEQSEQEGQPAEAEEASLPSLNLVR